MKTKSWTPPKGGDSDGASPTGQTVVRIMEQLGFSGQQGAMNVPFIVAVYLAFNHARMGDPFTITDASGEICSLRDGRFEGTTDIREAFVYMEDIINFERKAAVRDMVAQLQNLGLDVFAFLDSVSGKGSEGTLSDQTETSQADGGQRVNGDAPDRCDGEPARHPDKKSRHPRRG